MRKVKRALAAVLAVLMAGSLSACGVKVQTKDDANTTAAVTEAKEETEAVDTPTDEKVTLKIIDWSDSTKERRGLSTRNLWRRIPTSLSRTRC